MRFSLALALSGLFASANAHATFQYIWTDSSTSTNTCVRTPSSNSPVGTTGTYMGCNTPGTGVSSLCTVAAGSTISVEMHQQPGDRTCTTEAIGGNHDGPWIIYLGKVDDATSADPTSVNWIKIAQLGLVSANPTTQVYYWGTDSLNDNCGKATFKIPSSIPSGNYLLRAEVIALHVASSSGGAQHYMSCFQLNITGGGSATLTPTVKFPGGYTLTDPGILFDLYTPFSSYTIPGPALFVDSGSGGSSGSSTSTSRASSTSTSRASSTTSAASAAQTAYGQCGGSGWTGPTTCVSGYACTVLNTFYSQCVPA